MLKKTESLNVQEEKKETSWVRVSLLACLVVFGGVGNSVAGKIVTVPMSDFSFFLGLFNSFIYTVVYFGALFSRVKTGIVPIETIKWVWRFNTGSNCFARFPPIKYLVAIGLLDGLGQILDLTSRPHLPGALIQLLPQANLLFGMVVSFVFLHDEYTYWQIWSVILLLFGICVTLTPTFNGGFSGDVRVEWVILCIFQTLPTTFSFMFRDKLFRTRKDLDPFIVSSHNSLFQLLLQPVLAPISLILNPAQLQGKSVLTYVKGGFQCWAGITPTWLPASRDCSPQPWTYFVYIAFNLMLNIGVVFFLKEASMVVTFLVIRLILPLSVIAFFINWPLLPASPFNWWCIGGLSVILGGIILFRVNGVVKEKYKLTCCSPWLPLK